MDRKTGSNSVHANFHSCFASRPKKICVLASCVCLSRDSSERRIISLKAQRLGLCNCDTVCFLER